MTVVNIRLSRELDRALEKLFPRELRGKRKSEVRVHMALREYLKLRNNGNPPLAKTG